MNANTKPTSVQVYDTPSGLGGSYEVSVIERDGDRVHVRIWYGRATHNGWERWREFDGYTFWTDADKLTNPHTLRIKK